MPATTTVANENLVCCMSTFFLSPREKKRNGGRKSQCEGGKKKTWGKIFVYSNFNYTLLLMAAMVCLRLKKGRLQNLNDLQQWMSAHPLETFLIVPFGLGLEVTMRMGFMLSHTRLDTGNTSSSGRARPLNGRTISRHQQLMAATGLVSVHGVIC